MFKFIIFSSTKIVIVGHTVTIPSPPPFFLPFRRADEAKSEIHLPSDIIDRLSTHHSLHDGTSLQYPVARVVGDDEKDFILF